MIPTGYPYFRWWVKDAESDEFYLTCSDAELGFYHRCLNRSWNSGGLPMDPGSRAKLLGRSKGYCDKLWKTVGKKFSPSDSDPTRLVNRKQEEERVYVHLMSTRNSRAGQVKNTRQANGSQHTYGSGSESGSENSKKNTLAVILPPGYAFDEQYEAFRNECKSWGMNVIDPEDFIASWWEWSKLDGLQRADAIAGIAARRESGADPQFAKSPKNFLRGREWKRNVRGSDDGLSAIQRQAVKELEQEGRG